MRVAAEESDIPFSEAAVRALGRSGALLASRFLAQFFETCTAPLKPTVVVALGRLGERSLVPAFRDLLPKAIAEGQGLLARNTLLTLAHLKATAAIPFLRDMAAGASDPEIALSALLALGKVSSDPAWFDAHEGRFIADLYRHQVFDTARAQVRMRAQWKLEDYLAKLFAAQEGDAKQGNGSDLDSLLASELASELATFESADVLAGLDMFPERRHFAQACLAIRNGLESDVAPKAFESLVRQTVALAKQSGAVAEDLSSPSSPFSEIPTAPLHREEKLALLHSVAAHRSPALRSLLFSLKPVVPQEDPLLWEHWLDTLVLSLPDALAECEGLLQRGDVPFPEGDSCEPGTSCGTAFINAVVNAALISSSAPKKQKAAHKLLDRLLDKILDKLEGKVESKVPVAGAKAPHKRGTDELLNRVLRGFGQLRSSTPKILALANAHIEDPAHAASCLFFLERAGGTAILDAVSPLLATLKPADPLARNIFKTLAACPVGIPESHAVFDKVDAFLDSALSQNNAPLAAALLSFLGKFPCTRATGPVAANVRLRIATALKNENEAILLPAIVAAKALGAEDFADALASRLDAPSAAVSGRALDALLFLRGNRPKLLVFTHLEKNSADVGLCEKVIRDLKPPQDANAYFVTRLDALLCAHPTHPLRDGFLQMRETLASGVARRKSHTATGASDAPSEMDEALKKRIEGFDSLNDEVKSALRAAEAPFLQPDVFNSLVDKSISILEYAKALDLILEHELGRQLLFPKLESQLAQFQNIVHAVGLAEDSPQSDRVARNLGLERAFSPESFPLHKMATLCRGVLTGKILYEHWKVFDGLRAWAVVLLLFCRPSAVQAALQSASPSAGSERSEGATKARQNALLTLKGASDNAIIDFAKRLIELQEVRNPAAHRKTHLEFAAVEDVRREVFSMLATWRSFR
jgi:hypothetical protein